MDSYAAKHPQAFLFSHNCHSSLRSHHGTMETDKYWENKNAAASPNLIVSPSPWYTIILLRRMTFYHLMPSWLHLIGIALNSFPPFCFCCSWFCIWFKFAPFQFLPTPLNVWVQLLDRSVFKCLLSDVSPRHGSQRLLVGSVSRSVLLIKHLSVSTSYHAACFLLMHLILQRFLSFNICSLSTNLSQEQLGGRTL